MSFQYRTPLPEPLTPVPEDDADIPNVDKMRELFRHLLFDLVPVLDKIIDGTFSDSDLPENEPRIVVLLWESVDDRLKRRGDLQDLVEDYDSSDETRRFLMALRMMQLDIRGDPEMYHEAMNTSDAGLAKLIRDSRWGFRGFERKLADEKFLAGKPFPQCLCFPKTISISDVLRVLPCSYAHALHEDCLEEHFKKSKQCPSCNEWVL